MSGIASPASITKEGWMTKKGKKRWFILVGKILYWFTKEPPLSSSEAYFKKKCQNCRVLSQATEVTRVPPQNAADLNTFALSIESDVKREKDYVCEAATLAEMQDWIAVLAEACKLAPGDTPSSLQNSGSYATTSAGALSGGPMPSTSYQTSPDPANTIAAVVPPGEPDAAHFDGDTNLMSFGWFHGTMTSDEAFAILELQPVGAYLVRVSASRPACFVVSYVADMDKVIHVVWEWDNDIGWTAEGQEDGFNTVPEILAFYASIYTLAVIRPQ